MYMSLANANYVRGHQKNNLGYLNFCLIDDSLKPVFDAGDIPIPESCGVRNAPLEMMVDFVSRPGALSTEIRTLPMFQKRAAFSVSSYSATKYLPPTGWLELMFVICEVTLGDQKPPFPPPTGH